MDAVADGTKQQINCYLSGHFQAMESRVVLQRPIPRRVKNSYQYLSSEPEN